MDDLENVGGVPYLPSIDGIVFRTAEPAQDTSVSGETKADSK